MCDFCGPASQHKQQWVAQFEFLTFSDFLFLPGESFSSSTPQRIHRSLPFNQSVPLKRISLFWDFNPAHDLISETAGIGGGASKPLSPRPAPAITPARTPINHTLVMPLGKLIFRASELGHVGQVVEAGLVVFQAFFTQIKTRKERSVMANPVRLCLRTADYFEKTCDMGVEFWVVFFLSFFNGGSNVRLLHISLWNTSNLIHIFCSFCRFWPRTKWVRPLPEVGGVTSKWLLLSGSQI